MLSLENILENMIDEINYDHLEKVVTNIFNCSVEDIRSKINLELSETNNHIDLSKYKFEFQIDKFEDLMLFLIQSNNIDFQELLRKIEFIEKNNIILINENIKFQISQYLMKIAYRTMIFDVNHNRINKVFANESPSLQFKEYLEMLNTRDYRISFIKKYNNLITLIDESILQINTYIEMFLMNLINDVTDIKRLTNNVNLKLSNIQLSLGDVHNNGESVIKCIFENESVFYKPRNGNIDMFYSFLINHINDSLSTNLKSPNLVLKENYFWVSEIIYMDCKDSKQINNFYYELGVHLCLLHILGATDFHSDNLIASQGHPILVDLESVLGNKLSKEMFNDATLFNKYKLSSSVKTTGILPFPFGSIEGSDFSGIGGKENVSSFKVPTIKNGATSLMSVASEHIKLEESKNHPKYQGNFIDEKEYKYDLIEGFEATYDLITENKREFDEIINKYLMNINVRYINNATMYYGRILNLSFHPLVLQSLSLRDLFISYYLFNEYDELSANEINDVIHMNIPYFYFKENDNHLYHLNQCYKNHFDYKLKDSILYKLNCMSIEDKKWQINLILDSLKDDDMEFIPHMSQHSIKDYSDPLNYKKHEKVKKFEELINNIEDIVQSEQQEINNSYSWITKELYGKKGKRRIEREVMDINLYRGLSGMSLYYFSLYVFTNNERFLHKAKMILNQVKQEIDQYDDFPLGAYDGIYSYIYVCGIVYKETKEAYYLLEAINNINKSKKRLKTDRYNDFISGNAGALTVLVNLYSLLTEPQQKLDVLEAINISVNRLIENSQKNNEGFITWKNQEDDVELGFAHGTSGIAYALKLYIEKITLDSSVEEIVLLANKFEETHKKGNYWPHPYSEESKPPFAWCHGSPGIMLNREKSNFKTSNSKEIINHIFQKGFSRTHCLCHGDLGNAVILKDILNIDDKIQNIIYDILKDFNANDLKCGVGNDIQTIDLMTGITGISYGLIYIMNFNIPNILRLEI
ncbi:type 2 lanthipeptide synthetase LanM family protein [Macrococcus capreoli]